MTIKWTKSDLSSVTIIALFNGLWLGAIAWLVLGLWLEVLSFYYCWIGATLISWLIAIKRVANAIEIREKYALADLDESELIEVVISEIENVVKEKGAEGLKDIGEIVERDAKINGPWLNTMANGEVSSARQLLLLHLSSCVVPEIKKEKYFITKGELNETGERLLNLSDFVTNQLLLEGLHDEIDAQKDRQNIRDEIKVRG